MEQFDNETMKQFNHETILYAFETGLNAFPAFVSYLIPIILTPNHKKMLKHLERRFPQWQVIIEQLFNNDPDFRALCNNYEETAKTLAFWIRLSRLPAKLIDREKHDCKAFLQELETDIILTLQSQSPPAAPGDAEPESNSKRR